MKKKEVIEAEIVEDKTVNKVEINEEEKTYFFPRLIAYAIDIMIVAFASSIILMALPRDKNYDKYMEEYKTIQANYIDQKISMDEYVNKSKEVVYDIDKAAIPTTLVGIVLYIGYFIVFQTYNKGQTFGKKLMKIKVISTKKNDLDINQVAIRSIIIDTIGINLLMLGSILFISKDYYLYASTAIQSLSALIVIVTLLMVFIRKDGKGLHDVAAGTKVVTCK